MIILTHTARNNHQTQLSFASERDAKVAAYRMRRSPKTRSVALYYSVLDSAQWPASSNLTTLNEYAEIDKAIAGYHEENVWFKVWNYISEWCRWAWR